MNGLRKSTESLISLTHTKTHFAVSPSYIEKYGDYGKALMAYNMGDYGAQKSWENGVTSSSYSTTILDLMQKYEEVLHNAEHDGA